MNKVKDKSEKKRKPKKATNTSSSMSYPIIPTYQDSALIYEQDYEYELAMIADMERRETRRIEEEQRRIEEEQRRIEEEHRRIEEEHRRIEEEHRRIEEEHRRTEEQRKKEEQEVRNYHIKEILRRLKLGGANINEKEREFILILENWMDSQDSILYTDLSQEFHCYLEKKIRVSKDTKKYMQENVKVYSHKIEI